MSDVLLVLMIPLGRRWKSYSLPSTTTVCPALLPPCKERWKLIRKAHSRRHVSAHFPETLMRHFLLQGTSINRFNGLGCCWWTLSRSLSPPHPPPPPQAGLAFSHIKPAWECDLHSSAGGAVTAFRTQGTSPVSGKSAKAQLLTGFTVTSGVLQLICHVYSNKLACLRLYLWWM